MTLAPSLLPRSGLAEILVEGFSPDGVLISRGSIKLAVQGK
jgi:hypothetical protein